MLTQYVGSKNESTIREVSKMFNTGATLLLKSNYNFQNNTMEVFSKQSLIIQKPPEGGK